MSAGYASLREPIRLGDRLLEAGLITRTHLDLALDHQGGEARDRPRIGRALVDLGCLAEDELTKILGVHLAIPLLPFPLSEADLAATRLVPASVARAHRVVPCRVFGGALLVAATDVVSPATIRILEGHTSAPVVVCLTSESDLNTALLRWYGDSEPRADGQGEVAELGTLERDLLQLVEDHERLERNVVTVRQERQRLVDENRAIRAQLEVVHEQTMDLLSALTDFEERMTSRFRAA